MSELDCRPGGERADFELKPGNGGMVAIHHGSWHGIILPSIHHPLYTSLSLLAVIVLFGLRALTTRLSAVDSARAQSWQPRPSPS